MRVLKLAVVAGMFTSGGALASALDEVLVAFADGAVPGSGPALPLKIVANATAGSRIADIAVLVGLSLGLLALGYVIRRGSPSLNPWVFTSAILGALMLTVVNLSAFQVQSVLIDREGVTETRYNSDPVQVRWAEVAEVQWQSGSLYPVFTPDGALMLTSASGAQVHIPQWADDPGAVAAVLRNHLAVDVPVKQ